MTAERLGGRAAWTALILVALTQAVSMVDRQILAILVPRIKADLGIADAEMGLLYGTVFALFYAVFSLPLGRLADGWVRTRLLAISIAGWSVMTGLAGFANGFGLLMVSRLGVGIGEASVQPAGMSLLSDRFPKAQRGIIGAVMAAAVALGLGGALVLGGFTADAWDKAWPDRSVAPLGMAGWQAAFVIAAIPGLVLAVFLARLPEPQRGAADGVIQPDDPAPFKASLGTLGAVLPVSGLVHLARRGAGIGAIALNLVVLTAIVLAMWGLAEWTNGLREANPVAVKLGGLGLTGNELQWAVTGLGAYILFNWFQSLRATDRPAYRAFAGNPALMLVIAVASFQTIINYGVMAWTPAYIIKNFGQSPAETGLQFGALSAGLGIIGPLIAGPIADAVERRVKGGRMWVTLAALAISPFLAFAVYSAGTIGSFYAWFTVYSLVLTMWLPPIYAALLDLVPARLRGMVMSFYILAMTILGLGLGPYTVGLLSDLNGGHLGQAILSLYWIGPAIVVLTALAIWRIPKDEAVAAGG